MDFGQAVEYNGLRTCLRRDRRNLQVERAAEAITLLTPIDLDTASDDEIIAAYMADGETEDGARVYLDIIRGKTPPGAIVD